jgi:hypothetical protein
MANLRELGAKTIYIDCDYPPKLNEARQADSVFCASQYLAELYSQSGISHVTVLPEAYEALALPHVSNAGIGRKIRCVWFGSMDQVKYLELDVLRKLLTEFFSDFQLIEISDSPGSDKRWSATDSWAAIASCDIAVITGSDVETSFCKSGNRIIQAMALGLPVIAHDIPAYRGIIKHGRNGFICRGQEEWAFALNALRSGDLRERLRRSGHRYARRYFRPKRVGDLWASAISGVSDEMGSPGSGANSLIEHFSQIAYLRWIAYRTMKAQIDARITYNVRLRRALRQGLWRDLSPD